MAVNIRGRSFLKLLDYTPAEIRYLLDPVSYTHLEETKNTLGLQMIQNGHNARSFYIFSRVSIPYFPGICKGEGNGDYRGRESPIERL